MKRPNKKSEAALARQVDEWNAKHPIGTPVNVRKDDGSIFLTKTRSEAWAIGGHSALVSVEGISGGYDLGRVTMRAAGITPAAMLAAMSGDMENFLVASTPGGIEAQEAREQKKAVAAQRLPKDGTSVSGARLCVKGKTDRQVRESLGFIFGDDDDDIFVNVTFPTGWRLEPTHHSMWNELLDDKGRKRASMFYKGAFYDRHAHITLTRRYSSGANYDNYEPKKPLEVVVSDQGKVIHTIGVERLLDLENNRAKAEEDDAWNRDLNKQAQTWLDKKFPNWIDPCAYWDWLESQMPVYESIAHLPPEKYRAELNRIEEIRRLDAKLALCDAAMEQKNDEHHQKISRLIVILGPEMTAQLVSEWLAGGSSDQLATKYSLSRTVVREVIRANSTDVQRRKHTRSLASKNERSRQRRVGNIPPERWRSAKVHVVIEGKFYPSCAAAARATGIPASTVHKRFVMGVRGKKAKIPVTINDVSYPSVSEAARQTGMNESCLYSRVVRRNRRPAA